MKEALGFNLMHPFKMLVMHKVINSKGAYLQYLSKFFSNLVSNPAVGGVVIWVEPWD